MSRVRIVLPKGRLFEDSFNLLKKVNLVKDKPNGRSLITKDDYHELIVARVFDVPVYVEHGIDIGITGSDVVEERESDVFIPLSLPFGKCRLSVIVKKGENVAVEDMEGWRIATKYPNITKRFFLERGVDVEILELKGTTEIAPNVGIADGIVEIVEKGETIKENGLTEIEKIMERLEKKKEG